MKTILLSASLGLLGLTSGAAVPDPGAITIHLQLRPVATRVTIAPDGKMTIEERDAGTSPAREYLSVYRVGMRSYARVRALLKPLRAHAGTTLACDSVPATALGPGGPVPVDAVVRWADGIEVKVPLGCSQGPAEDEIELVRAAVDATRNWANEPVTAASDGGANAAMVD